MHSCEFGYDQPHRSVSIKNQQHIKRRKSYVFSSSTLCAQAARHTQTTTAAVAVPNYSQTHSRPDAETLSRYSIHFTEACKACDG
jgi:hypothetical protein